MAISFDTITNFFLGSSLGRLAGNFSRIRDEFGKVVYRDGSATMTGNLDMNGRRIINVQPGIDPNDVATVATIAAAIPALTKGDPGPASAFRANLSALKAANVGDGVSFYAGATWRWTLGNYASLVTLDAPGAMFVASNNVSAAIGAWVRQDVTFVNFAWFGAVAGLDSTNACKTAISVANALGLPMTASPSTDAYLLRDTLVFSTPFFGLGAKVCRFKAFSAADFSTGKALIETDATDVVFRDFGIDGLAVRNASRSADQTTSNFNGDGFRLTANANKIKLYNVRVNACRRGFDYNNEFGHINAYGCAATNCWWNLWINANTGDFGFWGCDYDGPLFASIGLSNVYASGTKPGGISAAVFEQCHLGFGPYGIHQATGGNATVGLLDVTFIHCRFEQIGNRAISISAPNSASVRFTAVGHSWSTFDAYKILGDAAHPVQDYARVLVNVAGGSAGSTMRDEGTGWSNGSTNFHTLVTGFMQHYWTDGFGTAGYKVNGPGGELVMHGSQPGGYTTRVQVPGNTLLTSSTTLGTVTRQARHITANNTTVTMAFEYAAPNATVAQVRINGTLVQLINLPAGNGSAAINWNGTTDATSVITLDNASGVTIFNNGVAGYLNVRYDYGMATV